MASQYSYEISEIHPSDKKGQKQFDNLLQKAGIRRDNNLDYIAGLYDDDFNLLATGACYANTLRCFAVDGEHQGEGLIPQIVAHLIDQQMARGNTHLFLYTKCENSLIFAALGFYEIARADNEACLMENRKDGFSRFLEDIRPKKKCSGTAALVMNCNPFTLGHRYLIERAASENERVYLFVVSEDASLFPFTERFTLVKEGCSDLPNVILRATGSYMISSAVFPSYFLKDESAAIKMQARLDLTIFAQIAAAAGITRRYAGDEPTSVVTGIYNEIMREQLPTAGVEFIVLPRKEHDGAPISASSVRKLLHDDRIEETKALVPDTTYRYFFSPAGQNVLSKIRAAKNIIHY
jgi:[citrate (pro-3S)-lyase] ligase